MTRPYEDECFRGFQEAKSLCAIIRNRNGKIPDVETLSVLQNEPAITLLGAVIVTYGGQVEHTLSALESYRRSAYKWNERQKSAYLDGFKCAVSLCGAIATAGGAVTGEAYEMSFMAWICTVAAPNYIYFTFKPPAIKVDIGCGM